MNATDNLEIVARTIFHLTNENPSLSMKILYILIVILSITVYKLGFARKLTLLKSAITYILLMLGCSLLTLLATLIPIVEALLAATFVLGIYKIRLHQSKKDNPTT